MTTRTRRTLSLLFLLLSPVLIRTPAPAQSTGPTLLTRDQAGTIMPATVFYRGRTAGIQARNSAGLKFPAKDGDKLLLAATVDTSGYSSAIQDTYQAYLITEFPIEIGGKTLAPGAYGMGFIAGDQFVALDLGGNKLLTAASTRDTTLPRPTPLQILADPSSPGRFRLYSGRSYVTLTPNFHSQ